MTKLMAEHRKQIGSFEVVDVTDEREVERLRAAGRARAARFSWEQAARGTLSAYERAVSEEPASRPADLSRSGGGAIP